MSTREPDVRHETPDDRILVLGMVAAPAAWFLHLLIGFGLARHACTSGGGRAGIAIASIVAIMAAGAGLWLALRSWRAIPADNDRAGPQRSRFMALSGVLLSGLFTLIIVLASLPAILMKGCW